jgi:hypothetical protein
MADNSKKISELVIASGITGSDRIVILSNPNSNAEVKSVTLDTISANIQLNGSVPATSSANGVAGTIRFDTNYIYVCVANNVWKRSPLSAW